MLLAAGLVTACNPFTQLRANVSTLVLIPLLLWLLHRSVDDRRRIWWTVPVLLAWANLHGGFVFGLGMVGLWAICISVQDWYRNRRLPGATPKRVSRSCGRGPAATNQGRAAMSQLQGATWPLWPCTVACIAVAAVSPFGLHNLTHPLVIASSKAWRQVPEWRPLLESPFAIPRAFFMVIGLMAVLGTLRLAALARSRGTKRRAPDNTAMAAGAVAFEWILAAVAVLMAFQSQRFVPLVMLTAAGPLASSLAWLVQRLGGAGLAAVATCVLLQLGLLGRQDRMDYQRDNPVRRGSTLFDRMHFVSENFPVGAADFLACNHIVGNAVCEWEWEGYLRWVCPQVKLLIGGRAQQIYNEQDMVAFARLYDPDVAATWCRQNQVQLAVQSFAPLGQKIMGELLTGGWAAIYSDGQAMVLVDPQAEPQLLRQAQQGQLTYPSQPVAALSRAACLTTTDPAAHGAEILAAVLQVNAATPMPQAYLLATGAGGPSPALRPAAVEYLRAESSRLARTPAAPADRLTILLCRRAIQVGLVGLYTQAGQPAAARAAQAEVAALDRQIDALQAEWN